MADLLLVGWMPASEVFLRTLVDSLPKVQFAQMSDKSIGRIIILGDAIGGGEVALDRREISIYYAAELIRRYPELPFIFSGFSDRLSPKGISEADAFKQLVIEQGLLEKNAHYENAVLIKPMILELSARDINDPVLTPKPWLLITSAYHMYRSLRIFQKQEIEVIPVLVDYQTSLSLNWGQFDPAAGMQN